jgi:hypothetical protein
MIEKDRKAIPVLSEYDRNALINRIVIMGRERSLDFYRKLQEEAKESAARATECRVEGNKTEAAWHESQYEFKKEFADIFGKEMSHFLHAVSLITNEPAKPKQD